MSLHIELDNSKISDSIYNVIVILNSYTEYVHKKYKLSCFKYAVPTKVYTNHLK